MQERAPTRIVVHPASLPGVADAISQLPNVEVIRPHTDEEVESALRDDSVFVSHVWKPGYLQPGLRWIQSHSAGIQQFPVEDLRARGVILSSASGVHIVCAEHAVGLLLCLSRDIHQSIRAMEHRSWDTHIAAEIAGRTVVVLGLGPIGVAIAERLRGWDVRLIGVTRSPGDHDTSFDVRPLDDLVSACLEASILMVALPDAPGTRQIVSGDVLDALGDGWLVNISRGSVIDQGALIERLRDGRLRGAGLDVVDPEPLPGDSPLWNLPNVILTPHMAGLTPRYGERLAALLAHNLTAHRGDGAWRNRIV